MKHVVPGFTLIEWTLYFFLIMVVMTGMFQFVAGVRQHLVGCTRQAGALSQLSAAQDACVRDVGAASDMVDRWHELGPTSLAWQSGNKMVCWLVEAGTLVRREKFFDATKKAWVSKHKSVVARGTVTFKVVPLYAPEKTAAQEKLLIGFDLYLSCQDVGIRQQVHATVALKNGRV